MNAVKRLTSGSASATSPDKSNLKDGKFPNQQPEITDLSPELVPIVTLISSQNHRRYYEGIFMLYYDLNGDGKPAEREWKEVYGILTGNQLAYWDAANLAEFRNNPSALLENSSKPNYINFTDSVYNAMKVLPAAKQNLDNVIIVSTTLKNRYIIQFKSANDLNKWYVALRLSNYEYQLLQLAYTGALLSARGSRLSDIKTILAEKRFDHEDWVSIRYGSGMAWKRCYAVVEPSTTKRHDKFIPGRILFFENDQKKKKQLMAVVTNCSSVAAVYPQSHLLIDHSTMLKLEGYINFKSPSLSTKVSKKAVDDFKNTSIFLMPEQHSSVPGFDTLIRFLIPLLDSFGLYGRPKRLKAERTDPDSLLFGLPTLPRVHYLELDDINQFSNSGDFLNWDIKAWNNNIKSVLKSKIDKGYEGCGSSRGFAGAINSLNSPLTPNSSTFPKNGSNLQISQPKPGLDSPQHRNVSSSTVLHDPGYKNKKNLAIEPTNDPHKSVELSDIYQKYSDLKSPSDQFNMSRNEILNGSHEELLEDHIPDSVRKISLSENVYPTDDHGLLSDSDNEDYESSSSEKIDSRQLGGLNSSSNNLVIPPYNNRNSSYSSVQSPMTQYQDFNEKFTATISPTHQRVQDMNFSDDDEPESPPPVPSHKVSSPYKNNNAHPRIQKPHYISSPNLSQNQFVSSSDDLTGYRQEPVAAAEAPPVISVSQQSSRSPQLNSMNRNMGPQVGHQPPPSQLSQLQPLGSNVYNSQKLGSSMGQFAPHTQQIPSRPQQSQQPMPQIQQSRPPQQQQMQQPPRQVPQQMQSPQHQQHQQQHQQHRRPQANQTYHNYNTGVPPPMNSGVPPPMNSGVPPPMNSGVPPPMNSGIPPPMNSGIPPPMNSGIPPSASFNQRPHNNQMGQMNNQRQYNNMRNYGNVPYQQYQYQPQQQVRPLGQNQQQQAPPSQSQRQNPNPYTRQY